MEYSQLNTLRNKRKAEETWAGANKFANTNKSPADCQMDEDEKVTENDEVGEYVNYDIKVENVTDFYDYDDEMEIDIQEEEFFQCSNCGSNFLTLDNIKSHELYCQNHNLIQSEADSELDIFKVEDEEEEKVQTIASLKHNKNEITFNYQEEGLFEFEQVNCNYEEEEKNEAQESERKSSIKIVKVETKVDKLETENVQLLESSYQRPKLTSNCIIALAIKNSAAQTVTSYEVMKFAAQVFPYFQYAVNPKWKNTLYAALYRSTLFKKINTIGKNKERLLYGFDPEPKSKLRIEKIIKKEVLNNEAAIKNCMRRPEDFDNLVSGDLFLLAEETGDGIDKDKNEEEEQNLNKTQAATFKDFDLSSAPLEIVEAEASLMDNLDDTVFEIDDMIDEDEKVYNTKNKERMEAAAENVEKEVQEIFKVQLQPQSSYQRPNLSSPCIAALAILNSPTQTATSVEVVEFATDLFPYFENAVNNKWKASLRYRLNHCNWFKKIEIVNQGKRRKKFAYGLDSEPKSQVCVEKIIENECLNNKEAIKSCMRYPEDFFGMVSGELCRLAEDKSGKKKHKHDGDEEEKKHFLNENSAVNFKDFDFTSNSLEAFKSKSTNPDEFQMKTFKKVSPIQKKPQLPPLRIAKMPNGRTFLLVPVQAMPHRPAILRKSAKANASG